MKPIFLILLVASAAPAAVPDRDWPSVAPSPIVDVPMRDAAITRGPDGMYYLTGTLSVPVMDGRPDFDNGREVRLWTSRDLKEWRDMGVVYHIHETVFEDGGHWQRNMRFKPDRPDGDRFVRGITEPELHHVKGDWYLCFSINGEGTGLAKR